MSSYYPTVLPMNTSSSLTLDQAGDHLPTDMVVYQRLIKKLIYLACGIRPDIAFVIEQLRCHNSNPRTGHICIAKQTFQYLKGTRTLGIVWGKDPVANCHQEDKYGLFGVVGYANISYAGDVNDQTSITRYCFFLEGGITT